MGRSHNRKQQPSVIKSVGSADFYSKISDSVSGLPIEQNFLNPTSSKAEMQESPRDSPFQSKPALLHPSVYANDKKLDSKLQHMIAQADTIEVDLPKPQNRKAVRILKNESAAKLQVKKPRAAH